MMINPKHSGYVGSVEKIKTLCHELARVKGEYQGVFAEAIRAVEALEPERSRKLSGFFERSTIKFPKSYQDLWFSGIIEIMRTVNNHAYFYGYEEYIRPSSKVNFRLCCGDEIRSTLLASRGRLQTLHRSQPLQLCAYG